MRPAELEFLGVPSMRKWFLALLLVAIASLASAVAPPQSIGAGVDELGRGEAALVISLSDAQISVVLDPGATAGLRVSRRVEGEEERVELSSRHESGTSKIAGSKNVYPDNHSAGEGFSPSSLSSTLARYFSFSSSTAFRGSRTFSRQRYQACFSNKFRQFTNWKCKSPYCMSSLCRFLDFISGIRGVWIKSDR